MQIPSVSKLLISLLGISSPSGKESTIIKYCEKLMKASGFKCRFISTKNGNSCLFATTGIPKIVLQTHADVVEPNLEIKETRTRIYGRGACDAKGSLASMLVACITARQQGLTNFGLLVTVQEESDFAGAQAVKMNNVLDGIPVIVGEPTNLMPVVQEYGLEVYEITINGKSAHTSEPTLGINAIDLLLKKIPEIKNAFTIPETLMSFTMITGGIADNIIPDRASLTVSIRVSPNDNTNYFSLLKNMCKENSQIKVILSIPKVSQDLPKSLQFLGKSQSVKYCTELAYWQNGLVYGPGNIAVAHTQNEYIEKKDLQKAVSSYIKIIETMTLADCE